MCSLAWFFLGGFIGSTITLVGMVIIMSREEKNDSESRKIAEGVIKELKQENAELKARISRCLETIQRFVTDNEECE